MSLQQQKSTTLYIDSIYEIADSMVKFFESIQFMKGLAIVEYVKAKR